MGDVRKIRHSIAIAAAVIAVALVPACHAQDACPWVNTATASGALGGPAAAKVLRKDGKVDECVFQLQKESQISSLRIWVEAAADEQQAAQQFSAQERRCAAPAMPLKGIGNQAVLCDAGTRKSSAERVIGQVRNQVFVVTIDHGARLDPSPVNNAIAEKAQEIAGEVADTLF